jgi:hypothetical protein
MERTGVWMKNSLRPSLWKVILAISLFYASSTLWRAFVIARISDTFPRGFPFQYYLGWGPCPPGEVCFEFNWLYLILDIVIWYVVSALIVDQARRKRT